MKVYVDASPSEIACVPDVPMDWSAPDREVPRPIPYCEILAGDYTNNEAEYMAVIKALDKFPDTTEILSDSQLVVNQLNHKWSTKNDRMRNLAIQVWYKAKGKVKFTWIPREQNPAGKLLG